MRGVVQRALGVFREPIREFFVSELHPTAGLLSILPMSVLIIAMTLLSNPKGGKTLPVGLMNLMKAQNAAAQYGQMYAGLVLVMLPTLILYICVQKKLTQGMTLGGLKG